MGTGEQLLVMMLGVPGAGKSYFARGLAESLGMKRITADEVRTRLFGSINAGRTPKNHASAYEVVEQEMNNALRAGESVVRDNQNNHLIDREMCRTVAQEVGAHAIIVWVQTPKNIAIKRCMEREATPEQLRLNETTANEFYERSMLAIERPTPDEDCVQIDGTVGLAEQLRVFGEYIVRR